VHREWHVLQAGLQRQAVRQRRLQRNVLARLRQLRWQRPLHEGRRHVIASQISERLARLFGRSPKRCARDQRPMGATTSSQRSARMPVSAKDARDGRDLTRARELAIIHAR
jgi:hypothetical protein